MAFDIKKFFTRFIDDDDFVSTSAANINGIMQKTSIAPYIKPVVEHQASIECNDGLWGVGYEMQPLLRAGEDTEKKFENILNLIPDDMYVQIQLWGSQNIERALQLWEIEHSKRNDENVIRIVKRFVNYYKKKTHEQLTRSIKTTLKDIRLFITFKHKDREEVERLGSEMQKILSAANFRPEKLNFEKLKPIYFEMFNPHIMPQDYPGYEDTRFLNRQSVSPDQTTRVYNRYFEMGSINNDGAVEGKAWVAMALQKLPNTETEGIDITDFSAKIGDNTSAMLNDRQFNDSFIISLNLQRCNSSEISKLERVQRHLNRTQTKNTDTVLNEKKREVESVLTKLNRNDALFKMDITVLVAGKNKEEAQLNAKTVSQFWNTGFGATQLSEAAFVHHNLFLSSIPFGISDDYFTKIQGNPYYLFVDNITPFLPVEADWAGNYTHILGISRRGELVGIDLFKTSEGFNAFMLGTTGAGKSALLNWILFCHYARGGKAFVLDMGDSYSSLINLVGGVFVQPDIADPISFNPFSTIEDVTKLNEYLSFLSAFMYLIGANHEEQQMKQEYKFVKNQIENTIKKVYIEYGKGCDTEISDIRDEFIKNGDPRLHDFAINISAFCKGGKYEKFFTGKTHFDFTHDLVGIDLTKLRQEQDLGIALIFVANYFFSEAVYKGIPNQELLALIDEFHKHMGKNPHMDKEVDEAYRTYRKHGAAMIVGSQGFNDYVDTISKKKNPVGDVVLGNSAWGFLGKQKEVARNLLIDSGLYEFDGIDKQNIRTAQGIKGEYSEFIVLEPGDNKIPVRFIFEPSFLLTISTDAKDKRYIKSIQDQNNCNRYEAIDLIMNDRGIFYENEKKQSRAGEDTETAAIWPIDKLL